MNGLPFPSFSAKSPPRWTRGLLGLLFGTLMLGLWAGLVRSGWHWPVPGVGFVGFHGFFMALSFFGGLIALERAVALGVFWGWAAPCLAALGGLLGLLASVVPDLAPFALLALFLASLVYTTMTGLLVLRHRTSHLWMMGLGALMWSLGSGTVLLRGMSPQWAPFWLLFLFLTILSERLERMRFLSTSGQRGRILVSLAGIAIFGGLGMVWAWGTWGSRLLGLGLLGTALGLSKWDTPWVQIRLTGAQRFAGWALGLGLGWLAVSGLLFLILTPAWAGPNFDAPFHAFFVGFTFSMVFAHAPLILPAVARIQVSFQPRLYIALVLLHGGLIMRVLSDLLGERFAFRSGSNLVLAIAILLFFPLLLFRQRRP